MDTGMTMRPRAPGHAAMLAVMFLAILTGAAQRAGAETLYVVPVPGASSIAAGATTDPATSAPTGSGSREHPLLGLERGVERAMELASARTGERKPAPIVLRLAPGHYWLTPESTLEATCGNCEDPDTEVPVTVGVRLSGRGIQIVGAEDHASVVHTGAGYGLLFEDCQECVVRGLVLTGGVRDTSGLATDAAVVARRSSVLIEDNWIRDNIGDPEIVGRTVVGIMGVTGREGSRIRIVGNRIHRNSWDGIALYRDATAEIIGNDIDGIDLARGSTIGGGRGVGIGLTWNAQATVRGNRVARYWKGIGVFVDARAEVEHNVVELIATWGLSLWDAGRGRPRAMFRANVVDSTGACGVALVRTSSEPPEAGGLVGNVISRSGQNPRYDTGEPYCFQSAIALHAAPEGFPIKGNLLYDNREPENRLGSGDVSEEDYHSRVVEVCLALTQWPATRESAFFRRHLTWLEGRPATPGSLRVPGMEGDWGWGRK